MVKTKISDLGDRRIAISGLPETRKPALGNGTAKPGDIVGVDSSTGKVVASDIGASELFTGIVDDDPTIAENTAIADGKPLSLLLPQKNHVYRTKIEDPAGAKVEGQPYGFSDIAGALEGLAALNTAGCVGYLDSAVANGDTVAEIRWK